MFEGFELLAVNGIGLRRSRPSVLLFAWPQTSQGAPRLPPGAGRDELGRWFDVLETWRRWTGDVRGHALDCGHFLAEECPDESPRWLRAFFAGALASASLSTIRSYIPRCDYGRPAQRRRHPRCRRLVAQPASWKMFPTPAGWEGSGLRGKLETGGVPRWPISTNSPNR